ncbi:hypothetical protein F5X97DRAFT_315241 [Nemania serpens]|nr:hypothetical protein F5X97DRAFT_315241 [Nemania serpens]
MVNACFVAASSSSTSLVASSLSVITMVSASFLFDLSKRAFRSQACVSKSNLIQRISNGHLPLGVGCLGLELDRSIMLLLSFFLEPLEPPFVCLLAARPP